jgi:hypothetical protein
MTSQPKELEQTKYCACFCCFFRNSKYSTEPKSVPLITVIPSTESKRLALKPITTPVEKIPMLDNLTSSEHRIAEISGKTLYADTEGELTEPRDDVTANIILH